RLPGTNELELTWMEQKEWEEWAQFTVVAALRAGEVVEWVAEGLDTVATVSLNGKVIARTENMFTPFRWPVKKLLRDGVNELTIVFASAVNYLDQHHTGHTYREFNDPVGNSNRIRKEQCQFGWDWGPRLVTAGVWRPISLEAWSSNRLESVRLRQEHTADGAVALHLMPELARADDGAVCHWKLSLNNVTVNSGSGDTIAVEHPQLWWPAGQGDQPLYNLQVEVRDGAGRSIGFWKRRIGLRTITLDQSDD